MKILKVTNKYNGKKLNKFLKDNLPNLSDNLFYKTLRKKDIKINGKRISENVTIYENDEISIYIPDNLLENNINLNIFFEDENILIIDKPINIEVVGEHSLTELIHKKYSNCGYLPMPCHRLDRNTKGLLLFAKNEKALNELLLAFKEHKIEKHYLALVYGIPKISSKKLEAYLFKDSKKSIVYISDIPKKGYLNITTSYKILEKYENNTSLLDVEIQTGRTHQIRAHLAHIGHPLIGDGKYGINEINKKMHANYQKLACYRLKFHLNNDSFLNYLNNLEFNLDVKL